MLMSIGIEDESDELRRKLIANFNLLERQLKELSNRKPEKTPIKPVETRKHSTSTTESINAKYVRLGVATAVSVKNNTFFTDKSDKKLKYKDLNGEIWNIALTA